MLELINRVPRATTTLPVSMVLFVLYCEVHLNTESDTATTAIKAGNLKVHFRSKVADQSESKLGREDDDDGGDSFGSILSRMTGWAGGGSLRGAEDSTF